MAFKTFIGKILELCMGRFSSWAHKRAPMHSFLKTKWGCMWLGPEFKQEFIILNWGSGVGRGVGRGSNGRGNCVDKGERDFVDMFKRELLFSQVWQSQVSALLQPWLFDGCCPHFRLATQNLCVHVCEVCFPSQFWQSDFQSASQPSSNNPFLPSAFLPHFLVLNLISLIYLHAKLSLRY